MKVFLLFVSIAFSSYSHAQLAKLTATGEQQYRLNVKRSGPVVVTPLTKSIRSVNMRGIVADKNGGYLKYTVLKGDRGGTKPGAYVHFMKLDEKLNIKSETETSLLSDGSENMEPVSSFEDDGYINLITTGADNGLGNFSLTYWQFDLTTLSLGKKNVAIASLPFNKDKEYDFYSTLIPGGKGFVVTVLEEGSKKEASILHCLSFDNNLALTAKRSTVLPFFGKKGSIVQTLTNNNGTVFCLLGYPDEKKEEIAVNSLLVSSKEKSQIIPLVHKESALINCAIGLTAANNVLLSGLLWPGKKDYTTGFVVTSVSDAGKMEVQQEETFSPSLLDALENADKKGLKNDYYVRSVSERANGIVDVVLNYCSQSSGWSGNMYTGDRAYGGSTSISDAVIFSSAKGKLLSTLPIKRNMEHNTTYGSYGVSAQRFSIPKVFSKGDDLYLMYFDNPSNTITAGGAKKPKWCDFTKGSLVLAKIDANFKPTQQELIKFDKDGDFRLFYELRVRDIDNTKYILSTDKYGIFTKNVKTASILVEVN